MRYLLAILLFCLSVISLRASDVDKPDDAFATWTDIIVRKDIGNWHVGGSVKLPGLLHQDPILSWNGFPALKAAFPDSRLYPLSALQTRHS